MKFVRRLSITPGTALGLIALFFALGGSAFAVGERIQSPSVLIEPAITSGFCALNAAKTSSFSRPGTLK